MHTLIFSQHDPKIRDMYDRSKEAYSTSFIDASRNINYAVTFNPIIPGLEQDPSSQLGWTLMQSSNRIVKRIKDMAEWIRQIPEEIIRFQVIFMFHQGGDKAIRSILRAMLQLSRDREWKNILDRGNPVVVVNAHLLSCESAADVIPGPRDNRLSRWYNQAAFMRRAVAKGLHIPYTNNPGADTHPNIYTYSIGNVVKGMTLLDPFAVKFYKGEFQLNNENQMVEIPGFPADRYKPGRRVQGTIYIHDRHGNQLEAIGLADNMQFNTIVNGIFPEPGQ